MAFFWYILQGMGWQPHEAQNLPEPQKNVLLLIF